MTVVMIVIAGAAAHFRGFALQERNNCVIRYAPTLDAVIVNYIT